MSVLTLCPYCSRTADEPTRDHAFGRALGGQATVTACRSCNNTFGSDVEDRLLRPATFLNFARATGGISGGRPKVRSDDGRPARLDLGTMTLSEPVIHETAHGYNMRGTLEQVAAAGEALVAAGRVSRDQLDAAFRAAAPAEPVEVGYTTVLDLKLATRLTAKIALGAGSAVYGDPFVSSLFATELRSMMWSPDPYTNGRGMWDEALIVLNEELIALDIPPIDIEAAPRCCVFVPLHDETAVFVRVGRVMPTLAGVVVAAPLPVGGGLPIVISDGPRMSAREIQADVLIAGRTVEPNPLDE